MKKTVLAIAALGLMVLFSGCAKPVARGDLGTVKYEISEYEEGSYSVYFSKSSFKLDGTAEAFGKHVKFALRVAALETKKMGYNYFVIDNVNINNLQGFPLNTTDELVRYTTKAIRKDSFSHTDIGRSKRGYFWNSGVRLVFKPVKDAMADSIISVWSVEQTLKDTRQI